MLLSEKKNRKVHLVAIKGIQFLYCHGERNTTIKLSGTDSPMKAYSQDLLVFKNKCCLFLYSP